MRNSSLTTIAIAATSLMVGACGLALKALDNKFAQTSNQKDKILFKDMPFIQDFYLFSSEAPGKPLKRLISSSAELDKIKSNILFSGGGDYKIILLSKERPEASSAKNGEITITTGLIATLIENICLNGLGGLRECKTTIDSLSGLDPNQMPWYGKEQYSKFNATNSPPEFKLQRMTYEYFGALTYIINHERAHAIKGHIDQLKKVHPNQRCKLLQQIEAEADDFATQQALEFLNNPQLVAFRAIREGDYEATVFDSLSGYLVALGDLKGLHVGFNNALQCQYPSREDRLARAKSYIAANKKSISQEQLWDSLAKQYASPVR